MSISNRWLPFLLAFFLLPALVSAASGSGSRTMDYAWLLFLKVNKPPLVDAGGAQQITSNSTQLIATVTDDPGDTLTYHWVQDSGPGIAEFDDEFSKETLVTFTASGTYTLKFTADDGEFESSGTVVITVTNTPPNVNAGADKQITHPTNSVSLSGSVSDVEKNVEGIVWSKVSGPGGVSFSNPSSAATNVTFSSGVVGTYELKLSANDWEFTRTDRVIVEYRPSSVDDRIDFIVALGDSITDGFGDSDCVYLHAKTTCSGYTPVLKNLLTAHRGYAHTIIDEGIGGTTSVDGRNRIQSVVNAYYPQADQYLVMYGTNDAASWLRLPSGLGLNPGNSGYPGTFKDNMQQIIDRIKLAGAQPALAKAPYAKGTSGDLNPLIREYNKVVDELRVKNSINIIAPDFYTWFEARQHLIWTYYMFNAEAGTPGRLDNIHPTHDGHGGMAYYWLSVLTH